MPSTLEVVAQQVEADIRTRGLSYGDKYLTGAEVGRLLNVSSVTANRAMQLLAKRGLLVRQRKSGTFVGQSVKPPRQTLRKRVHFLLSGGIWPDEHTSANSYLNYLLGGVVQVMPGVSVQADVVGAQEMNGFVNHVIRGHRESGVAGVVLIRGSLESQRQLSQAGVPTVVFGSVFPGVAGVSSVEVSQRQIGEGAADYLAQTGHQRVVALMLSFWSPGDNDFYSGFISRLHSSKPKTHVELQSIPVDDGVAEQSITEALQRESGPVAVVARSPWLARKVAEVAAKLGREIPGDVDLVLGNHHEVEIQGRRLPGARAVQSMLDCGRELGQMLQARGADPSAAPTRKVVGVEFVGG